MDMAVRARQRGDFGEAAEACRQALAATPGDAQLLGFLGAVLLESGDAAQALPHLQQAAAKARRNAGLIGALAQALFALGRFEEATASFRQAQRLEPAQPGFMLGAANSLAMQGKFTEARPLLERVVARFPQLPLGWFNLGNVLRDQGDFVPAIEAFKKALALEPAFLDARNGLGRTLHAAQRFDEAAQEYARCLREAPQFLAAHVNLVSVLTDQGRFDAAETACHALIALAPDDAQARALLADTFNARGRMADAAHHYGVAVQLAPGDAKLALSYAAKLCETGEFDAALRILAQQKAATLALPELQQLLGTMFLQYGFLAEGWAAYRQRPAFAVFDNKLPGVTLSRKLPENLAGLHICVLREQGLGDELFFLRYARQLAARGARVTYRASNKIASLVQRLPELADVIDAEAPPPACDAVIMLGDLPNALAAGIDAVAPPANSETNEARWTFPWTQPLYSPLPAPSTRIKSLEKHIVSIRGRLATLGPPPYLGITWRGGTPPAEQGAGSWLLFKTLGIAPLGAALKSYSGTFLALQRKPAPGEIAAMEKALGAPVHDLSDLNEDLEAMLALLEIIDEYVGVSNTNTHLRACAGKTARVLVPAPAEWRWMAAGRYSPWFPGFPVYRQGNDGDWGAALDELAGDLRGL
jgi:tetratricopeptide (TPR) repeat protein